MESSPTPHSSAWPFPFPQQDWAQTPPAVQTYLLAVQQSLTQLQARVEALEARLHQNSTTSHRPLSSDTPYKKPRHRSTSAPAAKRVGNRGMRDTARGCCPRQRCTISDLSGIRVARQPLPRPSHTIRTKSLSCPLSSWRYGTSYCIGVVYGLWHRAQGASASRACDGLWSTVQCAPGRVGRDIREWSTHGTNLVRVGLRDAP
jgi:Family of unknown function (DUF6444)